MNQFLNENIEEKQIQNNKFKIYKQIIFYVI